MQQQKQCDGPFSYIRSFFSFCLHQAQAAQFESQLAERVKELKANALAMEATARERDQLEARNTERLQVRASLSSHQKP